ncbi:hypothetical protein THICB3600015 [Thiomonas sp. CB3]|nr:hypothetical protein THICB3600015 [Thiomonas sp. CB3]
MAIRHPSRIIFRQEGWTYLGICYRNIITQSFAAIFSQSIQYPLHKTPSVRGPRDTSAV